MSNIGNFPVLPSVGDEMRRSLAVGLAAFLLAGAGCASDPLIPIKGSAPNVQHSSAGITFSYPAGWYRTAASFPSSFTDMVAAVSNQPIHDPCAT